MGGGGTPWPPWHREQNIELFYLKGGKDFERGKKQTTLQAQQQYNIAAMLSRGGE